MIQLPRITPTGDDIVPVVDGEVLVDSPRELLKRGHVFTKAFMTGVATEEWTRHLGFFLSDLFMAKPHLGMSAKFRFQIQSSSIVARGTSGHPLRY